MDEFVHMKVRGERRGKSMSGIENRWKCVLYFLFQEMRGKEECVSGYR